MIQHNVVYRAGLATSKTGWVRNNPACNAHSKVVGRLRFRQVKCPAGFAEDTENATSPDSWNKISMALIKEGMKVLTSDQLIAAQGSGATVIDVRPTSSWEEEHVPDSINVQLYRPIEGWSPLKVARRMGYAAFGILDGTEINDRFMDEITEVVGKTDPVVLVCTMGGSLDKTTYYENGQPTRSLIAAYELIRNGYEDVRVHKSGIQGWSQEGRCEKKTCGGGRRLHLDFPVFE